MPLAKLKPLDPAPEALPVSPDLAQAAPLPSPARMLQERLAASTAPAVERWSPRRSLAFIVVTSCALWFAILTAAAELVHAVA